MNIVGLDESGELHAVWWSPGLGSPLWTTSNLSEITGAPKLVGNITATAEAGGEPLEAGSIASAVTRWSAIEVVGRTSENEVATYWWAPTSGGWVFESITDQQAGDRPRIAGPVSIALGRDGSQHIAGVSAEGEVIHLYWLPDGSDVWRAQNLTELALG
jgi:hypothetical protein